MSESKIEGKKIAREKHSNIFEALSAFQGELKPLKRTGRVQFKTKSGEKVDFNYTPLSDIMEAIYPLLQKHGLSVRHELVRGGTLGTKEGIEAILTHETYKEETEVASEIERKNVESGVEIKHETEKIYVKKTSNELRSGVVFINQGSDMKDVGGAITYARRYTLTMVLGIASEDDNDAKLLEERGQAAITFAFSKAMSGIESAKTVEAVEKAIKLIIDDKNKLAEGKAGALGLSNEQYDEILKVADEKKKALEGK